MVRNSLTTPSALSKDASRKFFDAPRPLLWEEGTIRSKIGFVNIEAVEREKCRFTKHPFGAVLRNRSVMQRCCRPNLLRFHLWL